MNVRQTDVVEIRPAGYIQGDIFVPGDKSISHRLAMIGSIAEGRTQIENFASSADCHSTLECMRRLGVEFRESAQTVVIEGRGLDGLRAADRELDAENSGTTVRLMSGLLAGRPFESTFVGDASLSRRPMKRIIDPLRRFGADLRARDDNFLPLTIRGGHLHAIDYETPVASAQVKSAVLLAGMQAEGVTRVRERTSTRNHTEIVLKEFGAHIEADGPAIEIQPGGALRGRTVTVPGDFSSAVFFIAAALIVPNSRIRISGVGLNPTRCGALHLLEDMGGCIAVESLALSGGESVGNLVVESSDLAGMEIRGHWIPNIIDEIPVLAVLGTRTRKGLMIRDAAELRTKETDRIQSLVTNFRALGVRVEEFEDGLFVRGQQKIQGGTVDSFGDHRIAMAFAIAGLIAEAPITISGASAVSVSFPEFFDLLSRTVQP